MVIGAFENPYTHLIIIILVIMTNEEYDGQIIHSRSLISACDPLISLFTFL